LVFVLQRVFFSLDDTRTPFFLQFLHAGVFITAALVVSTGETNRIAIGVALSASLASTVQLVAGLIVLRKKLRGIRLRRMIPAFGVFFLGAGIASGAGVATLVAVTGPLGGVLSGGFGAGVAIVIITAVMSGTYAISLWLMKNRELADVASGLSRVARRIFRRGE
jgi:putative peptidoglycan lipid II flippase